MRAYRIAALGVLAAVSLGVALWVGGRVADERGASAPPGATLVPPTPLAPFALVDQDGRAFDRARLEGMWTLLFFGYTHCPDVCPMTLATLGQAARRLEAAEGVLEDTRFVFVSVDPARDSPERLKAYVAHFRPDFLGVTGTDDQIQALTGQLGVRYERGASSGPDYAIDHSAAILLIDPEARWRAVLPAPHDPARIAQALLVIRGRS